MLRRVLRATCTFKNSFLIVFIANMRGRLPALELLSYVWALGVRTSAIDFNGKGSDKNDYLNWCNPHIWFDSGYDIGLNDFEISN